MNFISSRNTSTPSIAGGTWRSRRRGRCRARCAARASRRPRDRAGRAARRGRGARGPPRRPSGPRAAPVPAPGEVVMPCPAWPSPRVRSPTGTSAGHSGSPYARHAPRAAGPDPPSPARTRPTRQGSPGRRGPIDARAIGRRALDGRDGRGGEQGGEQEREGKQAQALEHDGVLPGRRGSPVAGECGPGVDGHADQTSLTPGTARNQGICTTESPPAARATSGDRRFPGPCVQATSGT